MLNINKEFHDLIPPLTEEEYQGLEQSIVKEGCRDALVVWCDVESQKPAICKNCHTSTGFDWDNIDGQEVYICVECGHIHPCFEKTIIDGHNRYSICQRHGIDFKTVNKEFDNREDVKLWIIDNQLSRRNLPEFVQYELIRKVKAILLLKGRENMSVGGGDKKSGLSIVDRPDVVPHDTRQKIADNLNWSTGKVGMADVVYDKASDEVKQKLRSNDMTINQAYQTVKREEKLQAVEQKIDENKEKSTGATDIHATNKKYNIIYADPPWQYWEGGQKNQSLHYGTMSINDICNLPIKNISDDNCILFLWVTYPILQESFKVIESWGFDYSTCGFVWVKKNKNADTPFIGCGSWTRANSELCLIATKGSVLRLDAGISQVIESIIEEHSKKPAIVRLLITKLVGELPRIELFSRQAVDGWDSWGAEA